jgi:3' exoribonuclease, RNase T-like
MRFWFDTEFIEDGKTIDLISIGIVGEDGREFYAECAECDHSRASQWVKDNVIVHLEGGQKVWKRQDIAEYLVAFVGDKPEFWAYYADYDWVALCQLFGTMMDLPKGWPMFCRDLKQLAEATPLPEQGKGEHHALADAKWTRDAWQYLQKSAA